MLNTKSITCQHCLFKALCDQQAHSDVDYKPDTTHLEPGETLCVKGSQLTKLYAIKAGTLKAITSDGYIMGFYSQGDVVGLDGLNQKEHQVNLVAVENTLLCTFKYNEFYEELIQSPEMVQSLIPLLGHQMSRQVNYHLHHKDAEHKFCQFILDISKKKKQYGFCERTFYLPMQYKDIANHLDVKTETLSRTISAINKKGYLTIKNKLVKINDLNMLRQKIETVAH